MNQCFVAELNFDADNTQCSADETTNGNICFDADTFGTTACNDTSDVGFSQCDDAYDLNALACNDQYVTEEGVCTAVRDNYQIEV
jgi:hypothetical protein